MDLEPLAFAHRARSLSEAQLIRSILLEEGIFAMVRDENTPLPGIDLSPLKGEGQVGTEILVRKGDIEKARELIEKRCGGTDSSGGEATGQTRNDT